MTSATKIQSGRFVADLLAVRGSTRATAENLPTPLVDWLARLRLLYGVPFHYLVPHPSLLPPESARFFFIDRAFLGRLVDGALAVGKTGTREEAHHHAAQPAVVRRLDVAEQVYRRRLRSERLSENIRTRGTLSGLLLRSAAVSGWPGLEVKAYAGADETTRKLRLMRMDRLAPDILLCIFDGVPGTVDIEEPREGLQFGFDAASPGAYTLDNIPVPLRDRGRRVVDMTALRQALGGPAPAAFAARLLQFPYRQRFSGVGDPAAPTAAYTIQRLGRADLLKILASK